MDRCVIGRITGDSQIGMIFGGCADHGRPADIDLLDRFFGGHAFRDGLLEWVEIDHQQIDGLDPMVGHRRLIFGQIPPAQQAAMDFRM